MTLQSFLLFLRELVSLFRKRWDQSTQRLWYIFAFLRSRFSSLQPKKGDKIRRSVEPRPANPPTTTICASRLPPTILTPIVGGDTPVISSPTPISIQVRKATILDHEDPLYETQENPSTEHLGVDGYHLAGSGSISRAHDSADHHDEHEHTYPTLPQGREDLTSYSPVIPSRPISRPPSQFSHRQSQYAGYHPSSQYSHRPPSEHSYRSAPHLNGAEVAARGYLREPPSPRPSSPALSVRPPSIAGSVTSQVYRAPRPTTRVRRPSPIRDASRHRGRSSTPASARQSVHEVPPEVPALPQTESRTSVSTHHGPHSTTISFGPPPNPKGRLRPMIGIDRYEKHKEVVIDDDLKTHIFSPVTTQFVR